MRYLGIDFGTKKVGVAISDESGAMGFPHATFLNNTALASQLSHLIQKERIGAVVVGHSLDFHGNENPIMREVRVFVAELQKISGVAVYFEPEQLTSQEAKRIEGGSEDIDASAAAIILNSFLRKLHPSSVLDEP
jgi:putative holliday junction resolvase